VADQSCLRCGRTDAAPVAEGSDRLFGTTTERFQVIRCAGCGMMRLSPRPETQDLHKFYPHEYWFDPDESSASRWAERYRRLVLRDHIGFVSQIMRESAAGRMLDVGCGGGLLAGMLRKRGVDAVGLDSSTSACRIAWERHCVPAVTGDLVRHPFQGASFAVVTMFHVLEHLPVPAAFLSAARDLLRPGGHLIVQVPNADSWQFRLLGWRWNGLDIPRHLTDFRLEDLTWMLQDCGFEVVRVKHFSLRDNPAGLATSLAPQLDPMGRRVQGKRSGLLYMAAHFALMAAALPFALLEAAFGHGSTMMVQARKQ
jgi:SAM-dependent methyltransferase